MILELMLTSDDCVVRVDRLLRAESFYCKDCKGGRHPSPFEQVHFQAAEEGSQPFSDSQAVG